MCYSVAVEPPPPALTNAPGGSTSWGAFTIGYFSTNVLRGQEPNLQPDFRPPSDRLFSCKGALLLPTALFPCYRRMIVPVTASSPLLPRVIRVIV